MHEPSQTMHVSVLSSVIQFPYLPDLVPIIDQNTTLPIISQDSDDDTSIVSYPDQYNHIVIRIKDPRKLPTRSPFTIVKIKDPRIKQPQPILYRNRYVPLQHFTMPILKQQDSSSSTPPLRRSLRSVQTHCCFTHRQVNHITPCPSPRVGSSSPRVELSSSLTLSLLNAATHPITRVQCEYRHLSTGKVPGQCHFI